MLQTERKAILYSSNKRSLYIGREERVVKRANTSSTLMVSIEEPLELIDVKSQQTIRSKSFLIPAGMDVTIDTHGSKVAQCFLDDLGTDFARLIPHMGEVYHSHQGLACYSNLKQENDVIGCASYILGKRPSNEDVFEQFEDWISALSSSSEPVYDPRVEQAINYIKQNYEQNLSVTQVAASVGLSVPRLSQLFKQVTGVPMRRFRLWYRIFVTAAKLSQGYSLTDAAIAAGFSDYPQLCRVFKELTGSKPAVAKNNTEIRVLAGCY